jgi:hypothetical protein
MLVMTLRVSIAKENDMDESVRIERITRKIESDIQAIELVKRVYLSWDRRLATDEELIIAFNKYKAAIADKEE